MPSPDAPKPDTPDLPREPEESHTPGPEQVRKDPHNLREKLPSRGLSREEVLRQATRNVPVQGAREQEPDIDQTLYAPPPAPAETRAEAAPDLQVTEKPVSENLQTLYAPPPAPQRARAVSRPPVLPDVAPTASQPPTAAKPIPKAAPAKEEIPATLREVEPPWARGREGAAAGVPDFVVRDADRHYERSAKGLTAADAPTKVRARYARRIREFEWVQESQLTVIAAVAIVTGFVFLGSHFASLAAVLLGAMLLWWNRRLPQPVQRLSGLQVFVGMLLLASLLFWFGVALPRYFLWFAPVAVILPRSRTVTEGPSMLDWGIIQFGLIMIALVTYLALVTFMFFRMYTLPDSAGSAAFALPLWLGLVAMAWQLWQARRLVNEILAHLPPAEEVQPHEPPFQRLMSLLIWLETVKTVQAD